MKFSERNGFKPVREQLQIDSMDLALKNAVWNTVKRLLQFHLEDLYDQIIEEFYRDIVDTVSPHERIFGFEPSKYMPKIMDRFLALDWCEVYDFIEYIATVSLPINFPEAKLFNNRRDSFCAEINLILEREGSAYRLVGEQICPIIDKNEIHSIDESLNLTDKFLPITTHINRSLELLSNRTKADYRNSIKESISAVECCCRILTSESTLGKAIHRLENEGISIDNQLRAGFEKIYAYTNSKNSGIRHALIESGNEPTFNDAKYMLVSCSAFTSYLIGKSRDINLS